ncbi:MAG: GNAT family N-acetyltransferase [Sedimentisphaerales bacterium]|jgi:GNAT superfamily N-acetyltransferase
MAEEITIRKATKKDVSSIVELWKELMDFHKKLDAFFSRSASGHERFAEFLLGNIENKDSCVLVAADGGRLVGYCQACMAKYPPVLVGEKYVEIFDMAVTEKYQRQGIGRMIIDALRLWYADKNVDRIELKYLTANKTAEEFWIRMGFKPYLKTAFLEI